jgi:hypothetical protein
MFEYNLLKEFSRHLTIRKNNFFIINFNFKKKRENTLSLDHNCKVPRALIEVIDVKLRLAKVVVSKPCIIELSAVICGVVKLDAAPYFFLI